MASRTCTFKQQDVTRALRAADRAGVDVQRVEIDKDGKIVMVTIKTETANEPETDFDKWKVNYARKAQGH